MLKDTHHWKYKALLRTQLVGAHPEFCVPRAGVNARNLRADQQRDTNDQARRSHSDPCQLAAHPYHQGAIDPVQAAGLSGNIDLSQTHSLILAGPGRRPRAAYPKHGSKQRRSALGVWINADEIEVTLREGTLDLAAFDIPHDPQLHERLRTFCEHSGLLAKAGNPYDIVGAMQLNSATVSLPQAMVNA